jgi:aminoglycoside phosphotransferase
VTAAANRAVPASVLRVANGRPVRVVWENRFGGLTAEAGTGADRCFVKWAPAGHDTEITAEAARLAWALPFTPVPPLIGEGSDETGSWLVTAALDGENAAAPRWRAKPQVAVRAIGEGLRAMHDCLPTDSCPFSWTAEFRLAGIRSELGDQPVETQAWPSADGPISTRQAMEVLADVPPADRTVVCHGDSCAPNTLLTDDGHWSAHVDLGALGVADRWADLAIAAWSADLNYGSGWGSALLDAYGIAPDAERLRYYRLLGRCY